MKPADMWVYTFFPSGVGVFVSFFFFYFLPHKCCLDARGRKGGRDAAESLALRGDPTQIGGGGVGEPLVMQRDGERR